MGVDPHKKSVTIEVRRRAGRCCGPPAGSTPTAPATGRCCGTCRQWPHRSLGGRGRQRGRPAAGAAAARRRRDACSMCRRSWPPGCGSSTPATPARPTRPTRTRSRWSRCAPAGCAQLAIDEELVALRLLADRRDELSRPRAQTVNRLHRLLTELIPGGAKRDLSASQARRLLATVRPGTLVGRRTGGRLAAEQLADLVARRRASSRRSRASSASAVTAPRVAADGPVRGRPRRRRPDPGRRR